MLLLLAYLRRCTFHTLGMFVWPCLLDGTNLAMRIARIPGLNAMSDDTFSICECQGLEVPVTCHDKRLPAAILIKSLADEPILVQSSILDNPRSTACHGVLRDTGLPLMVVLGFSTGCRTSLSVPDSPLLRSTLLSLMIKDDSMPVRKQCWPLCTNLLSPLKNPATFS